MQLLVLPRILQDAEVVVGIVGTILINVMHNNTLRERPAEDVDRNLDVLSLPTSRCYERHVSCGVRSGEPFGGHR